jgi:hypothetical protein
MAIATTKKRKRNFIVQSWEQSSVQTKLIVAGGLTVGGYVLYKNIKSDLEDKKKKEEMDKLTKEFNTQFVVTSGSGQGAIVHLDLAKIATDLYDLIHSGLFGSNFFIPRADIYDQLIKVPKPYMSSLEYIYNKVYKENLESKVRKALSDPAFTYWEKVKYLFA